MDDRGANIDLVFRNGLKDFEVLPPPDAWDNIHRGIKGRHRPFILLRVAAIISVVLSMSFLAYRLSREISTEPGSTVMALNEEAALPGYKRDLKTTVTDSGKEKNIIHKSQKTLITVTPDLNNLSVNEKSTSPAFAILPEINMLSTGKAKPPYGLPLAYRNSSKKNIFIIKKPEQQYVPGNSTIKSANKWSVAALASPTYYSRFNSGNSDLSNQLMASEQPQISYSGGVAFSYKLNKRFSIQSGLFYSSLGQVVDGINSFAGFQKYDITKSDHNFEVLTTNGTVYTNNADVFLISDGPGERILTNYTKAVFDPEKANLQYINNSLHQNFSYLELPILLRYKFIDKTIDLNLIGGVSYNMLINNSVYTVNDGSKYPIGKTEGLNLMSLSSSLGMGMEYNFSSKLSLNLEPTFKYYLNPFNQTAGSKIHPYSFGIFSGVSYKF